MRYFMLPQNNCGWSGYRNYPNVIAANFDKADNGPMVDFFLGLNLVSYH